MPTPTKHYGLGVYVLYLQGDKGGFYQKISTGGFALRSRMENATRLIENDANLVAGHLRRDEYYVAILRLVSENP